MLTADTDAFAQLTIEIKEVSSAKSFTLDISACGKIIMNFQLEDRPCKPFFGVYYEEMTRLDQEDYHLFHFSIHTQGSN